MSPNDAPSVAQARPRRQNVPVPSRTQQEVEACHKLVTNRTDSKTRKEVQADIDARPQPLLDGDDFIFGPPVPKPLPNPSGPQSDGANASRDDAIAQMYLRKIATCIGVDLRAEYESGKIGLEGLREAAADLKADQAPSDSEPAEQRLPGSAKGKEKGRTSSAASETQVRTNYIGITHGNQSHPVQSKHADAAARRVRPQPTRTTNSNTTANSRPSPLTRTDSSTIHPGNSHLHPITPSSIPRHPSGQRTSTNATQNDTCNRDSNKSTKSPLEPKQHATTAVDSHRAPATSAPRPSTPNPASAPRKAGSARPSAKSNEAVRLGHHTQSNVNANKSNGAVRNKRNTSDSRYTLIAMGSWPPARSKAAHPPNANDHLRPADPHRRPTASPVPVDDDVGHADKVEDDVFDDSDHETPPTPPSNDHAKSKRATIKGHKPETQKVIKAMLRAALAQIIADGTYDYSPVDAGAEPASREDIVARAWAGANVRTNRDYPLLNSHLKVLDSHVTLNRTRSKAALKPLVDKYLGFDRDMPQNNIKLVKKWLLHGFHELHPDKKKRRLPFESDFIRRACRVVAFSDENAVAAKYPHSFYPIPKAYVAYVCAITHHIIYCYRDGPYLNEHLNLPMQLAVFQQYMDLLISFEKGQENINSRAMGTISDYCRKFIANAVAPKPAPMGPPREWSPDIAEPYICEYQEPSGDDEMDLGDGNRAAPPSDEDYEEPTAGPSNHRDAYHDPQDDVATDVEMEEEADERAPVSNKSEADGEHPNED